jgi:hypothetical protein
MNDYPTPAQCLTDAQNELAALRSGSTVIVDKEDLGRLIREAEDQVKHLETHLAKHGNTWES